jgi:hypothetical protein
MQDYIHPTIEAEDAEALDEGLPLTVECADARELAEALLQVIGCSEQDWSLALELDRWMLAQLHHDLPSCR